MTPAQAVLRAQSTLGKSLAYKNGAGGMHPDDMMPTRDGHCDCSGFVMWALGRCRFDGALWWDTSHIVDDAMGGHEHFARVKWEEALPGDVLAYGDSRDAEGRKHEGHIALVTAAGPGGPAKMIHCSLGSWKLFMDAIQQCSPDKFRVRGIVARCLWLDHAKGGDT